MKKQYFTPQVIVFTLCSEDIITGSIVGEGVQEDFFSFGENV